MSKVERKALKNRGMVQMQHQSRKWVPVHNLIKAYSEDAFGSFTFVLNVANSRSTYLVQLDE